MTPPLGRTPLVLHLDEDPARGSVRAQALREVGLDVVHVRDATAAALVLAETRPPDVVTLDVDGLAGDAGAVSARLAANGIPHARLAPGFFGGAAPVAARGTSAILNAMARSRATLAASLGVAARVELVCDDAGACQVRAWDVAGPRKPAAGGATTALVVDDHEDTRDLFVELLASDGHRVLAAANGHDALVLALAAPFDVVFVDLHLPGRSGPEVARSVRHALGPRAPYLVATTGDGSAAARRETARSGFDVHLVKPVDAEVLLAAMKAARTRGTS